MIQREKNKKPATAPPAAMAAAMRGPSGPAPGGPPPGSRPAGPPAGGPPSSAPTGMMGGGPPGPPPGGPMGAPKGGGPAGPPKGGPPLATKAPGGPEDAVLPGYSNWQTRAGELKMNYGDMVRGENEFRGTGTLYNISKDKGKKKIEEYAEENWGMDAANPPTPAESKALKLARQAKWDKLYDKYGKV
jgi:hypothetical protein